MKNKILVFLILFIYSIANAQDSASIPPEPISTGARTVSISTPIFPPLPEKMKYKISVKIIENEKWYTLEPVEIWTFESLKDYWGQSIGILTGIYLLISKFSQILSVLPFKITRKEQ